MIVDVTRLEGNLYKLYSVKKATSVWGNMEKHVQHEKHVQVWTNMYNKCMGKSLQIILYKLSSVKISICYIQSKTNKWNVEYGLDGVVEQNKESFYIYGRAT